MVSVTVNTKTMPLNRNQYLSKNMEQITQKNNLMAKNNISLVKPTSGGQQGKTNEGNNFHFTLPERLIETAN